MNPLPEALGRRLGIVFGPGSADENERRVQGRWLDSTVLDPPWRQPGGTVEKPPPLELVETTPASRNQVPHWREHLWLPLTAYAISRVLYLVIALIDYIAHGWSYTKQITNWDGVWYVLLTNHGYPNAFQVAHDQLAPFALYAGHSQNTLGFLPLYPVTIWLLKHVLMTSAATTGLIIALIGGFITTVLVQQLAWRWWGEAASRRVVLFFCLFPGTIVFSMVYSEGIMLPLVAGAMLAVERRRWVLAGLLAGTATAVGPVALAIVPALAVTSLRELRRHGWHDGDARRSLLAPLLAPLGILAFGLYLWIHNGTPFASYNAQRQGWGEKSTPMAIVNQFKHLIHEVTHVGSLHHPGIDLNYAAGALGAIFLIVALYLMVRTRPRMSVTAITWTAWVAVLTLTSYNTPPNPRMLLCAFPALMVVAYRLTGKAYRRLIVSTTVLLVAMSLPTYVGVSLRP